MIVCATDFEVPDARSASYHATNREFEQMQKILVSACLLGERVRYDGGEKRTDSDILQQWISEDRIVAVCPEVAGGLSTPRPPAEIVGGAGGGRVLAGEAAVVANDGRDVTHQFVDGARIALALARANSIRIAVLKEGSPSCGIGYIYDGTFSGTRVNEVGVTAALLRSEGIQVFSEARLEDAERALRQIEGDGRDGPGPYRGTGPPAKT